MNKLDKLIVMFPNEVNEMVDKLYDEKFPKKNKKTIFKFKAMGKEYTDEVFTKNYVNFIKDISKLHPYEMFQNTLIKSYISKTNDGMEQAHKIKDDFYVTSYSSTKLKINHIKDICELLEIKLTEII
jgi:hypothetical protein